MRTLRIYDQVIQHPISSSIKRFIHAVHTFYDFPKNAKYVCKKYITFNINYNINYKKKKMLLCILQTLTKILTAPLLFRILIVCEKYITCFIYIITRI